MPQESTPFNAPQEPLQRLRTLRKATVLGFVLVALLLLLVAFWLVDRSIQEDIRTAEATVSTLQTELRQLQTPAPPMLALMSTLTTTRSLAEQIRLAVPTSGVNWPQVIEALARYDTARVMVTSLTEANRQITITGQAFNDEAVVAYAQAIEDSNLFTTVVVQSIRVIPAPTATPLPTGSPTPGAPSAAASAAPSTEVTIPPLLATATTLAEFVIIVELD